MKTKYSPSRVKKEALRLYDAMGKPNNFYMSKKEFIEFYLGGYEAMQEGLYIPMTSRKNERYNRNI